MGVGCIEKVSERFEFQKSYEKCAFSALLRALLKALISYTKSKRMHHHCFSGHRKVFKRFWIEIFMFNRSARAQGACDIHTTCDNKAWNLFLEVLRPVKYLLEDLQKENVLNLKSRAPKRVVRGGLVFFIPQKAKCNIFANPSSSGHLQS